MQARALFAALAVVLCVSAASAADHLVPAVPGQVQALVSSGRLAPGDRVILEPGRHGPLSIEAVRFDPPVVLTGAAGGKPVLDRLTISRSAGLQVTGLTVMPPAGPADRGALVTVEGSRSITLDRLTIASAGDAGGWSRQDWQRRAWGGVRIDGQDIALTNSFIRIVGHAITSMADGVLVQNNFVELFSGDGIRGLGDNSVYRGNTIETCVDVDGNHDDGFQSWSRDAAGKPGRGVVRNVVFENNVIRNGNHPFTCKLQGVGLFDGIYEDFTIRGNTIIVDHWHGITVMGGRRVTVIGNTVADARPGEPGPPWIAVTAHKDGRPAEDSVVANNTLQRGSVGGGGTFRQPQTGVQVSGNRIGWSP